MHRGILLNSSGGRDITAQKTAENALLQAHRNLGILNTITRHDILNQLTAIFGFLELARHNNRNPMWTSTWERPMPQPW